MVSGCYEGIGRTLRFESSASVKANLTKVVKIVVEARAGGGGFVKLYDATSATGTALWHVATPDDFSVLEFNVTLDCRTACYLALSNAYAVVTFY